MKQLFEKMAQEGIHAQELIVREIKTNVSRAMKKRETKAPAIKTLASRSLLLKSESQNKCEGDGGLWARICGLIATMGVLWLTGCCQCA